MTCDHHEIKKDGKIIGEVTWCDNTITLLYVHQDYRKNGYGGLLLNVAEDRIKKQYKCSVLNACSLDESVSQDKLLNFYNKNGYDLYPFYMRWTFLKSNNDFIKYFK